MAESAEAKSLSLSEQYVLKGKDEKVVSDSEPAEVKEAESPSASEPVAAEPDAPPAAAVESAEAAPATASEESSEAEPEPEPEPEPEADPPAAEEESSDKAEEDAAYPSAKFFSQLETAPADFRFPTTNQTRHCFTRYVEYHRCVAVKGEDDSDCNKFKKYYRSLCPDEWVERWDEQRENGTFPGPL